MIERVVHPYQLEKALEHVIANKGSAGIDGISVREIRKIFTEKKLQFIKQIKTENYQVQPILGIEPSDSEHMSSKIKITFTNKFQKETEKPDYWEFLQPPKECYNKVWHKISHHYLNPNSNPIVLDLDPTKMPDKPLDKHGNTSIKG